MKTGQTSYIVVFVFAIENHQDSCYMVIFWGMALKR